MMYDFLYICSRSRLTNLEIKSSKSKRDLTKVIYNPSVFNNYKFQIQVNLILI